MSRQLSTLAGITNFQSGVGGGDDLLVKVKEDPNGGWFAQVHDGFYYIGTEEEYLFAQKGTLSFSAQTTGAVLTTTITGWQVDPTRVGPVIMRRSGQIRQLQRVTPGLRAFKPITFTGTDPKVAVVPASGILVQLCSQPVTGNLLSVPTTGDIISSEDYFYDRATNNIYIRATNPPSLFVTYVVDELTSNPLHQEEIVRVSTDGFVRTQFTNVWSASGSAFNPLIQKPTPNGLITVTGSVVSGNVITFNSSGMIASGDIVAVSYMVKDSYTVVPSGNVLGIRYFLASSGSFTIDYELGNQWYDTSQTSGTVDYIQLNPILEPRKSAFLYMVDANAPFPSASTLTMAASNLNPLYNPSGSAKVIIGVTVYDAELEPIPQQWLRVTVAGSGTLALVTPISGSTSSASGLTNGIGQVLYSWTMQGTGAVTITASVSGYPAASGNLVFIVRDVRYYDQASELQLGKLMMHMEDSPYRNDLHRLNAYYCYRDGAPFAPSGQINTYSTTVTFNSDASQFYSIDGLPLAKPVTVSTDADSIASLLVDPVPGDVLRAYVQTPVAGRIRTAAPIIIPRADPETA
jgi:hypothetical protein